MKKWGWMALLTVLSAHAALLGETPPAAKQAPEQKAAAGTNCTQLSTDEQAFAAKLTDPNNQAMFCGQFTPNQRQLAMQIVGQLDTNGNTITPDQAVKQVVLGGSATPGITPQRRPGGSCPIQQ